MPRHLASLSFAALFMLAACSAELGGACPNGSCPEDLAVPPAGEHDAATGGDVDGAAPVEDLAMGAHDGAVGIARDLSHPPSPDLATPLPPANPIGPNGGKVPHLYFAVVGDTRPPATNATDKYPTAVITKIYKQMEALDPPLQFVVATGDYMFANNGSDGRQQIAQYKLAASHFTHGPIFASMGNHECHGAPDGNCPTPSDQEQAYIDGLVTPLGKTHPWYAINIADPKGRWTAQFLITACNAWTAAQKSWLQAQLARNTTYTVLVRHEPMGDSTAYCDADMDQVTKGHKIDLFLVGHVHQFAVTNHQLMVGTGGAPLTGSDPWGFATVEQRADGFHVKQYDYMTGAVINSYLIPFL